MPHDSPLGRQLDKLIDAIDLNASGWPHAAKRNDTRRLRQMTDRLLVAASRLGSYLECDPQPRMSDAISELRASRDDEPNLIDRAPAARERLRDAAVAYLAK